MNRFQNLPWNSKEKNKIIQNEKYYLSERKNLFLPEYFHCSALLTLKSGTKTSPCDYLSI